MPNVFEKGYSKLRGRPADDSADPIPVGATNLTIGSALVAALALLVPEVTGWIDKMLGEGASHGNRTALAIAIIGAAALVFAADLLARGYASAHSNPTATPSEEAAKAIGVTVSIPKLPSGDETGWRVINARADKVLVVKQGKTPKWHPIGDVQGE